MPVRISNIDRGPYVEGEGRDGATYRFIDLGGEHLGARIEELAPGDTSSYHHYHTAEEEHVVVLKGTGTLHLGEEQIELGDGDHVWFPAGREVAHHIENRSRERLRILVFGERKTNDVVFYPEGQVVLIKSAQGPKQYTYRRQKVD